MYRAIVARRVRTAWRHLAAGDYEFVLDQLAPGFSHRFVGDHALGGERNLIDSQRLWFERLFRLLPDLEFTLNDVLVRGWPWRTRAVALFTVSGTVAGQSYRNEFVQTLEIRWGRISRVNVLEDTQKLARVLEDLAAGGVEEALAPPISDLPPDSSGAAPARTPGTDARAA